MTKVAGDGAEGQLSKAEGDALRKQVTTLTAAFTDAVDRLAKLEAQPIAPVGIRRLSKVQDTAFLGAAGDGEPTEEALVKHLQSLPPEEANLLIMKAAMRAGRVLADD